MRTLKYFFIAAVFFSTLAGCGKSPPATVEVTGTILLNGQKLDQVRVEFMPDPERDNRGPMSFAETDAEGKFRLALHGAEEKFGAVVGWHRVVLQDFKALNSRDAEPVAPRFGPGYGIGSTTTIFVEVTPDATNFEIELSKYPTDDPKN